MSAPAFTPGPWIADGGPGGLTRIWRGDAGSRDHEESSVARVVLSGRPRREIEANARLVAAAPELYAALRMTTDALIHLAPYPPETAEAVMAFIEIARAALAKAVAS